MEIMMDSNVDMESEMIMGDSQMLTGDSVMLIDDFGINSMTGEFMAEKSGISDVTILIIVVSICAILGVVLGIFAGKKSANK